MSTPPEYLETLKQVLRLTREGKIEWSRVPPHHWPGAPGSFRGVHEDFAFELYQDPATRSGRHPLESLARGQGDEEVRYVMRMTDAIEGTVVELPPMKATTDVALVVYDRLKRQDREVSRINERLARL
jgi:hypothetical protein